MMTASIALLALAITANGNVNQSAIDDVKSGKLSEARASWWGFDPADSTKSLQSAIDSGAKRVIIEDMGRPWIVTPLLAASDQELVFENGAVLQAKKGEFEGTSDSLLSVINKNNVSITGYGASWQMHRDDYDKPPYKKAEWRHTLQIKSSSNVKVTGLTMAESGGDGIYLGVATSGVTNKNIQIVDVVLEKHYRQGISVITAEDLLIENTIMRNTAGTAPMAGIDFEPNHPNERLVNCVLRNCVVEDNQGVGYAFYLPNMDATSQPISIRLENCVARGSNRLPVAYTNGEGQGHGPVMGSVTWVDCDFSGGHSPVVTLGRKPANGAQIRFENCRMKPGEGEPTTPAILFASSAGDQHDVGGVHFENCVIEDSQPRAVMRFYDGAGDLRLIDVTGTLTIQTGDAQCELEITPQWLAELHPGNTFKRFPKYDFMKTKFVPLQPGVAEQNYPQKPFSQRRQGTCVLFANQGSEVRLSLKHSQVGNYSGKPIVVKAVTPSEKQLDLGTVPFQSSATLEFVAPETGLYRIPIECDANQFQLVSTNCPTCMSDTTARVWFISSVGDLYFYVPAGTKEFGVKIFGEGMEVVGAAILNPQGTKVWEKATITTPEQFVGTGEADEGEIWTLRITKPATGAMEDYAVELQGIPPFLATQPTSLLRPAP